MENALSSYKFIMSCQYNIKKIAANINCLQKYTANLSEDCGGSKSLFLTLNTDDFTVNYLYDKKRNGKNVKKLYKRYEYLRRRSPQIRNVCNYITLDIEYESENENIFENTPDLQKYSQQNPSLQFTENAITLEKDDENKYKCQNCLKVYPSLLKIKQHYLRVHAPKHFKCTKCPRSFGSSLLLNRHNKDSHCTAVCSHCGKTYNNTYSLRHHERSHKLRLVCQTCGKVYKGKRSYNNHIQQKLCEKMRKSNAEATFCCHYCDKKYSQKTALSVHIRLQHENGKALICNWCGKKLSSTSRLNDHVLKHTKQKNFDCNICGGKFVTKASLLYHTRTHTGEKPYKCDSCDMRFLSASRRSEHVKRHHLGPDLECDICHGKFKGQSCLRRHKKRHFDTKSRLYHHSSQVDKT